jgi:sucrose-6F-phosphate phosphohydrolase
MTTRVLLCTDLDRTLLPNGRQPESPQARERFASLARHPMITLAYVTGRHRALVEDALAGYSLPLPRYVVADVGTTIYELTGSDWRALQNWHDEIAPDWAGKDHAAMHALFHDMSELQLQENAKQNRYKLSYYVPLDLDWENLHSEMQARLHDITVRANLVWSEDEAAQTGLLDVLPASASKLHAVEFLIEHKGFSPDDTLFAGDSGNDLSVLTSGIPSVLVSNAAAEVREQALRQATQSGTQDKLYLAQGDFRAMNGNYAAGILEGLAHYKPETINWWE